VSAQTQSMRDAIEREAAASVANFDHLADALADLLDERVRFLVHWQDIKHRPANPDSPQAPFLERRIEVIERVVEQKLREARALAFCRAFLRALRDREGELRTDAFGRSP
jgi:hypothetical protein